ncbi:MAG: PEP-CTERM sorting domain-containing protein [Burkholderiales bacterium]|nr:PEP-CTERM sorting domain-containing protein [Burkholderiales bacterium]
MRYIVMYITARPIFLHDFGSRTHANPNRAARGDADGAALGSNGFARIVASNDVRRGRSVSNLVSLEVFHAAAVSEPSSHALLLAGLMGVAWVARRRPHAPAVPH